MHFTIPLVLFLAGAVPAIAGPVGTHPLQRTFLTERIDPPVAGTATGEGCQFEDLLQDERLDVIPMLQYFNSDEIKDLSARHPNFKEWEKHGIWWFKGQYNWFKPEECWGACASCIRDGLTMNAYTTKCYYYTSSFSKCFVGYSMQKGNTPWFP